MTSEQPWHLPPPCNEAVRTVFSDDQLLVVEKPAFLLSVPGRGPEKRDSVYARLQDELGAEGVYLIHRLDLDTSGLMVFARTRPAQAALSRAFQQRRVHKRYEAVVQGQVEAASGDIDLPLIADWPNRPRQKVCFEQGKAALTGYRVRHRGDDWTYLDLLPVTGRSHQLRIHCRELGHPILGCDLYSPEAVLARSARLLLHAAELTLPHPASGKPVTFYSPAPFAEDWAAR